MTRLIGLLVGVDEYRGGIPALRGCRNDVERAREVLARRADASGMASAFTTLLDGEATREGLIGAFRSTFADVVQGDVAVFYFAGHGSQQEAPAEHLAFEPDGLEETIVLHDSRAEGGLDVADTELGALVREVAARGAHVFVVLDCCHSGSGLREADPGVVGVRRAPAVRGRRPVETYLVSAWESRAVGAAGRLLEEGYVLLAACRSDQTAKEVRTGEGQARGALSVALEVALISAAGSLTYLQLHRAVATAVAGVVNGQTPVLECRPSADAERLVLGGAGGERVPLHVATFGSGGWWLDAGALHGLPVSVLDQRPVRVTLHALTAGDLAEDAALARAHVTAVRPARSSIVIDEEYERLDPAAPYRVVVRELPASAVTVAVGGSVPHRDTLIGALARAQGVVVGGPADPADLLVTATGGELTVTRPGATRPLVAARPLAEAADTSALAALSDEVTRVGRWLALMRRVNPTTRLSPGEVVLDILDGADRPVTPGSDGTIRLLCPTHEWARARIRVSNRSARRLFVSVLALSELYGVSTLFDGEGEWLDPGTTVYVPALDGTPDLYFSVPDGEQVTTDVLIVLAATQEFTTSPLRQQDLELPGAVSPTRAPRGTSDRVVSTSPPPRPPELVEDWISVQQRVTTVRQGDLVPLRHGRAADLDGGTVIESPSGFSASARVVAGIEAARNALVPLLPSILVDAPDSLPFSFVPVRSEAGAVDVLELSDVRGAEAVTADRPLVIRLAQSLSPGEVVLPILFDGRDYLPVGLGLPDRDRPLGGTLIRLTRLPTGDGEAQRTLGGAVKILFRKLVTHRLGLGYDWPHVSLISYDATGQPHAQHDPVAVRAGLIQARTALLLIHGIIGDTARMALAVGPAGAGLHDRFDAVLALDYENLDTAIERSGSDLAAALRRVGIEAGSGPRLTVMAHSMGGLVARCFIERQGGAAVTDHLITCGTPHLGSPWPRIQDAMTVALGVALNIPLAVTGAGTAGIGSMLAFLTRAAERFDTALDEMRPGSDLLTTLAGAPDPGLPYTAVRGTLAWPRISGAATAEDPGAGDDVRPCRVERIVRKLTGAGLDLIFRGEPNDLAVGVTSAAGVGSTWAGTSPRVIDAACNHLTFFSTPAGWHALAQALQGRSA